MEHYQAPFLENTPLARNCYWTEYGENKIEAEHYLQSVLRNQSTGLVILRPPYVYGEDNYAQRESFIFDHILKETPILIPKDGRNIRDFFPFYDYDNILEITKYKEVYQEETDFLKGLTKAFEWYQANKERIIFKESVSENEAQIQKDLKIGHE